MHNVSQRQATEAMPVTVSEKTTFWRDKRFRNMECMAATFITHEFAPHTHDTFSIGAIESGCQIACIRGEREFTGPGALYLLNPGEVHDGAPGVREGYRYRMIYPDIDLFTSILEDVTGRTFHGTPSFSRQLLHDPELAAAFQRAHCLTQEGKDQLAAEEGMYGVLSQMFARYHHRAAQGARPDRPQARLRLYRRQLLLRDRPGGPGGCFRPQPRASDTRLPQALLHHAACFPD